MQVSKDMIIRDMIESNEYIAPMLLRAGMHCIMCPAAQMESLEEACMVHGIDCDVLVDNMNEILASLDELTGMQEG